MYNWEKEQRVLRNVVRPVTEEHRKELPTYSHSKLECFTNCPMQYYLKYEQKHPIYIIQIFFPIFFIFCGQEQPL